MKEYVEHSVLNSEIMVSYEKKEPVVQFIYPRHIPYHIALWKRGFWVVFHVWLSILLRVLFVLCVVLFIGIVVQKGIKLSKTYFYNDTSESFQDGQTITINETIYKIYNSTLEINNDTIISVKNETSKQVLIIKNGTLLYLRHGPVDKTSRRVAGGFLALLFLPPCLIILPLHFKRSWSVLIPKISAWMVKYKLLHPKTINFQPHDVSSKCVIIPHLSNVILDYDCKGEMSHFLERIEIRAYKFTKNNIANEFHYFALFKYSKKPQTGKMIIKYV